MAKQKRPRPWFEQVTPAQKMRVIEIVEWHGTLAPEDVVRWMLLGANTITLRGLGALSDLGFPEEKLDAVAKILVEGPPDQKD